MNVFQIKGGRRLEGVVDVGGSKNTALAIMSAVVLCDGKVTLTNVPKLSDTRIKAKLIERFGAKITWKGDRVEFDCTNIHAAETDEETVRAIRTSFYLLGPLLARTKRIELPAPGGCKIGARPVDFHIKGLRALGASVDLEGGTFVAECDQLFGAEIYLDFPSAGATQHLMSTAVLAKGITTIQNAAIEPEVTALASFLNMMGARIEGAGTNTITITGVERLESVQFRIPADRMQAGTYLLAGAITGGDVTVRGILPEEQTAVVNKLREAGAEVEEGPDWVRVAVNGRLSGINVKTMPHPGFPTDMQQPMAAVLALADGVSIVEETIYESRIGHIQELNRLGANIRLEGRSAIISGVSGFRGAVVEASDLRAGAALVLAALAAKGESTIKNIQYIDRGYESFEKTLSGLGANVRRVQIPDDAPLLVSEGAN